MPSDQAWRGAPLGAALLAATTIAMLTGCDSRGGAQAGAPERPPPPPPVDVANPVVREIVEWDEYTGRFEAVERVELRARVSGYLESVHFRDGETVSEGDLLFVIDREPFEAVVDRAEAELVQARSAAALARAEFERAEGLLERRAMSREDFDIRRASLEQADAQLAAREAALRSAELELGFTEIRAPIAGRISDSRIDVGNLISGGSAQSSLLTTIVALDPIYFVFDASEADALKYVRLSRQGRRPSSRDAANPVYVRLMDETDWSRRGEMNFVDNELDLGSGTMRGRAVFDNPDHLLVPGVFGRMRLLGSGEYEAMLLPDEAIVSDQSRKLVMTVDAEGVVVPRHVELGPMIDGLRVVRSGITAQTRVIIRGLQRARPGAPVTPEETTIASPTPAG